MKQTEKQQQSFRSSFLGIRSFLNWWWRLTIASQQFVLKSEYNENDDKQFYCLLRFCFEFAIRFLWKSATENDDANEWNSVNSHDQNWLTHDDQSQAFHVGITKPIKQNYYYYYYYPVLYRIPSWGTRTVPQSQRDNNKKTILSLIPIRF